MICTFCGTENRPGNRFCGMCGVRLERRKEERRASESDSRKCPSCAFENEPGHRFCGMCGLRIDRRAHERRGAGESSRATAVAHAQLPTPEARADARYRQASAGMSTATLVEPREEHQHAHAAAPESPLPVSSLGGPSFLGLNDMSDGDYLLEDEDRPRRGLRALLMLVILAAIAGLILVQYRANLHATAKPLDQPKTSPVTAAPAPEKTQPASNKEKALASVVAGAQKVQAAARETIETKASTARADNSVADDPVATEKPVKAKVPAKSAANDSADDSDTQAETKTGPSPALVKAQQYLHGRGVRQSCEQGMVYLKAATRENDPDAAVQMGALYSSGFCVAQNRVKAYQWFASAQEMKPDNRWITKNLNQLWAQMTPDERRQIR